MTYRSRDKGDNFCIKIVIKITIMLWKNFKTKTNKKASYVTGNLFACPK